MKENSYDLIIIGAGPTGLSCGIEASKAGLKYLIVDKGVLVNSIYHFPTNMTFFSTSQLLEIGNTPFISHSDKPTRREALEYYRRIQNAFGLNVQLYEEVNGLSPFSEDMYQVKTSKGQYFTHSVVLATGYYDLPRLMNIPGENLPKVKHYYDDPHPYAGQKVLVVGAANSACDVALETHYKGAEVTMAVREPEIYKGVKYWILPNIENRIKEGSIKAYFNTTLKEIREREVVLQNPEGELTLKNDFVLAMTGYQPNYRLFERLGIRINEDEDRTPYHNLDTLESNLPNVYLAGVINAGMHTSKLFIENTREHGKIIVQNILKKKLAEF